MPLDDNWLDVGVCVRRARRVRGLTIGELAAASGLSANAVGMVERGQVAPTVATLFRLAEALGVWVATLLDERYPEQTLPDSPPVDAQQTIICLNGSILCETVVENHRLNPGENYCTPGPCCQRWSNTGPEPSVAIVILQPRADRQSRS